MDVGSSDFSWALVTVGVGRAEDADDLGIGELALIKAEVDEAAADLAASGHGDGLATDGGVGRTACGSVATIIAVSSTAVVSSRIVVGRTGRVAAISAVLLSLVFGLR